MFIHLGQDCVIKTKDIIAIFDFENTSVSGITKEFLINMSKKNNVIYINEELPKSFVIAKHKGKNTVYISSLLSSTLIKRAVSGLNSGTFLKAREEI